MSQEEGLIDPIAIELLEGIALVCLPIIDLPDTEPNADLVAFDTSAKIHLNEKNEPVMKLNGEEVVAKAMFVRDAHVIEGSENRIEGTKLTLEQARDMVNKYISAGLGKPLFCMHGFNVNPYDHLVGVKEASKKFRKAGKLFPIPVIWPSLGGSKLNYFDDRHVSLFAGTQFKHLVDKIESFPGKSLMVHSMGNRVLRYAADPKFKFDNIFMVAADVRHDTFNTDYIKSDSGEIDPAKEEHDGLRIFRMLSTNEGGVPKGKIYVLSNGYDYALNGSSFAKLVDTTANHQYEARLGKTGAGFKRNPCKLWVGWVEDRSILHPTLRDYVETKDFTSLAKGVSHSYQFDDDVVEFYGSVYVE